VLCLLAATRLGAITVPLSVREQTPGLHYMLEHCGARLLVHDAELQAVLPAKSSLPGLQWRVSFDGCPDALDFDSLLAEAPLTHAAPVQEEDTVVILYTSGTTGRPKGAMLSHFGVVAFLHAFPSRHGPGATRLQHRRGAAEPCHRPGGAGHHHAARRGQIGHPARLQSAFVFGPGGARAHDAQPDGARPCTTCACCKTRSPRST
jgi:acyl-CoA synthetase (AMP-forming)/AMP-acid ligase II